jgi:hypothetical protein
VIMPWVKKKGTSFVLSIGRPYREYWFEPMWDLLTINMGRVQRPFKARPRVSDLIFHPSSNNITEWILTA